MASCFVDPPLDFQMIPFGGANSNEKIGDLKACNVSSVTFTSPVPGPPSIGIVISGNVSFHIS